MEYWVLDSEGRPITLEVSDNEKINENQFMSPVDIFEHLNSDRLYLIGADTISTLLSDELDGTFARIDFARWIRNVYGMWHQNNPYTIANPNNDGSGQTIYHPDNLSGKILREVLNAWKRL